MNRNIVPPEELTVCYPPTGTESWLTLYWLQTPDGEMRQVVERSNKLRHCCKVLPIFFPEHQREAFEVTGKCELHDLIQMLLKHDLRHAQTFFAAEERPLTFRPAEFNLVTNYLLASPGGVVEKDEDFIDGGARELIEELALKPDDVHAYAPLWESPLAFDAGIHVEWSSLAIALCFAVPKPVRREGIVPEACEMVPLFEAHDYLRAKAKAGVGIDASPVVLLDRLYFELRGGWNGFHH